MSGHKITVVGTGYVGMSMAVLLAQHNEVTALDINEARVELINQGKSTVVDKEIEHFLTEKQLSLAATLDKRDQLLTATTDKDDVNSMAMELQKLSDKHVQRLTGIEDESNMRLKANINEMTTKYELYSHRLQQHKNDINDLVSNFYEQQAKVATILESRTKEMDKSLAEMRRSQMTIMESQNTIREMKTEVRDMLEDLKQRMGREPSPRQV